MYTLDNCEMKKLLEKNEREKDEYLATLRMADKHVRKLLEMVKVNFPNYTDHSIEHSYRILHYLFNIMSDEMKMEISSTEVFCLILSAMCHDLGMCNSTEKDVNTIRARHAEFSKEAIEKVFNQFAPNDNMHRIIKCVIYVCESHGKDMMKMYSEPLFTRKDVINGDEVRFGFLSILLRVGDLLDIEADRTSYMVWKVYPEYYDKDDSLDYHIECYELDEYDYSSSGINAIVKTKSQKRYKTWSSWFSWLKDEILQANTYYFPDYLQKGRLPKLEYKVKPTEGVDFCTEELRFEIDDKGVILELLTNSVYTGEFDFLRELIQNAIDACLLDCYLDTENIFETKNQRRWPLNKYIVSIAYSEEENKLIILDNGIGMDINELKKYLFKMGNSGYKYIDSERGFDFPAIDKFGIVFFHA